MSHHQQQQQQQGYSNRGKSLQTRPSPNSGQAPPPTSNSKQLEIATSASPVKILHDQQSQHHKEGVRSKTIETLKFLNEHLEYCGDNVVKNLLDQTEFTVIGVLGCQGVGKSSIMSELCGSGSGSDEAQYLARHQTSGIDICVNSDRYIFLDAQPLLSPSILTQMIKNETKIPLTSDMVSFESLHELQDWLEDVDFWKFVRTLEMLKSGIPDVSAVIQGVFNESQHAEQDYSPELVFVFNKISEQSYSKRDKQKVANALDRFFPLFMTQEALSPSNESSSAKHVPHIFIPINESLCDSPESVNVFNDSYQCSVDKLRSYLLATKKKPFSRSITEKEWLRNASKVWDIIKRSNMINEYLKTTQKMLKV